MKAPIYKMIPILAMVPGMLMGAPVRQIETNVPVDHVYAPAGFDSNDSTEVVVTGFLPNLCYKAPRANVSIKDGKVNVGIKALKNVGSMSYCADVIVPFIETVHIGLLDQGKYQLLVNENSPYEKKADMKVAEASSNSIDEAVYANVSEIVKVEGGRKVQLKGYNPSDCFELEKVEVVDNGFDTYSVLPKLRQVREFCPKKMVEFSYEFSVPERLQADQVLLHVRVMDGKSMNALYNNKIAEE